MSYPVFWRSIWEMLPDLLLRRNTATDIARKGLGELGGSVAPLVDISGTFSMRDSADGFAASDDPFPDGTSSMQRDSDLTGANEARVLVNVKTAGTGTLGVTGGINATASLSSVGVNTSSWVPVLGSYTWTCSGSATIGLVQLQIR